AAPDREIALFAGLRPFQAKIVVLMGKVQHAVPGTHITREGERKDELYVVLNGTADVRRSGSAAVIRRLGRGDVIGEMGVIRHQRRSADVVAAAAVDYLVLDSASLQRIQRRHPRIAAAVFRNLTRILSDRLEATTNELVRVSRA
ncbi:MAG TPA: cyclic nucleotide-binding domain-containing protein, partial [Terriglobales bacterium]|nr:cyclic nucleotide-binding domain-containing protein [Terriglobales bacterium]